jgi:hypothetical protein
VNNTSTRDDARHGTTRSRLGPQGLRPRHHLLPRWVLRVGILASVAIVAFVYFADAQESARVVTFLLASVAFVGVCAVLAIVVVAIGKLFR